MTGPHYAAWLVAWASAWMAFGMGGFAAVQCWGEAHAGHMLMASVYAVIVLASVILGRTIIHALRHAGRPR